MFISATAVALGLALTSLGGTPAPSADLAPTVAESSTATVADNPTAAATKTAKTCTGIYMTPRAIANSEIARTVSGDSYYALCYVSNEGTTWLKLAVAGDAGFANAGAFEGGITGLPVC
jgi:hypothetical protein